MPKNALNICFIVPPQIVDSIAKHGNTVQKERVVKTAEVSDEIRSERVALGTPLTSATGPAKNRNVHDAQTGSSLPGQIARSEGSASSGDAAVDEAYEGTGSTYDLFLDEYSRDSMDDNGMDLVSSVRESQDIFSAQDEYLKRPPPLEPHSRKLSSFSLD